MQGRSGHWHCRYRALPSAGLGCHFACDLLMKKVEVVAQAAVGDKAWCLVQKAAAQVEERLLHPVVPVSDIVAGGLFLVAIASES